MNIAKSKSMDMTTGVIWKELVVYAIPLLLGNLLQQFYTVVDCVTVGQLVGKEALAAISATDLLITIVLGMFIGISTGATIAIANRYGAKDDAGLHRAVHTTVSVTLIIGVLMTVFGVVGTPTMLRMISTPEDVFAHASLYLRIYFAGIIGQVIYNMGSGILRAVGDSERPLVALVITSILNIVLDLLFVAVFKMGVAGVAIATIVSQMVSAIYLCWLLMTTDEAYRVDIRKLIIDREIARNIFAVGIPIGLQRSIVSLSNTIIISRVNYFGSGALAGWGAFRKVEELALNGMQSLALASATFVGQNKGADQEKRARKGTGTAMVMTFVFMVSVSLLFILFRGGIIRLFNSSPEVEKYGSLAAVVVMPFVCFLGIYQIAASELQGNGQGTPPMIVAVFCFLVIRQIYLKIAWDLSKRIELVYFSFPVGWIFAAVIMVAYMLYARRKRQKKPAA